MNQGFKSYKSDIVKTNGYKKANLFQQDLLYLNDLCVNSFPDIDNVFPKQKREQIVDSLMKLLSHNITDRQVYNGYVRFYLSHFDNQHTNISGLNSKSIFPYILHFVGSKWYLWDISNDYDSLLIGKQVTKLNDKSIDIAENELFQYVFAENDVNKRNQVSVFMNRPDLLKQFGIIKQSDSILISFENGESVWIKTVTNDKDLHFRLGQKRFGNNAITKYLNHNYNIALNPVENYAYFQFNRCNDKIDSYETMSDYLKPWIVPFAKLYLNRQIKKKNNQKTHGYVDVDRPVFKEYLKLMFDSIKKQGIDNLIIDLRYNPGGSSLLCNQLLYYLTEKENLKDFTKMYCLSDFNKQIDKKEYNNFIITYDNNHKAPPEKGRLYPNGFLNCDSSFFEKIENRKSPYYISKERKVFNGKVIVLANYGTGSAAALLTTLLQDNNIAIVIGTSVGNNPIGATIMQPFRLPNSKFSGSVATGYLIRPNPTKGKFQIPDYWIENNVDNLVTGKDMVLEKAKELIKKK